MNAVTILDAVLARIGLNELRSSCVYSSRWSSRQTVEGI